MNFLSDLQSAVDYIEENLSGEISATTAAQRAACSVYHFQRMFSYVVGVPLSEYIRCRRMTLAAFDLQQSDVRVVDLAVKYGYDSQSSFTRAFQALHGVTPTAARVPGTQIAAYPRLSFQFILKGAESMRYRIEKTVPYQLFGQAITPDWAETDWEKWGEYADKVLEDGSHDATNIAAGFPGDALEMIENDEWDVSRIHLLQAVHFYSPDGAKQFLYGWELPAGGVDASFTVVDVPETTWAVFSADEADRFAVKKLYDYCYTEWFPSSGYQQAEGPVIEKYSDSPDGAGWIHELWMPVKTK